MTVALWITAVLLTLVYLAAGAMKSTQPKEKLRANLPWVDDFSAGQVRAIGIIELLGALGVILPLATGIAPIITPIAAIGLVIVQVVAMVIHVRRGEKSALGINAVLALLAAAVAALFFLA